jgi:hypothetical protein
MAAHYTAYAFVMAKFTVAIGLDYKDKRAEPGDVVDDIPKSAVRDLLAINAIVPLEDDGDQ